MIDNLLKVVIKTLEASLEVADVALKPISDIIEDAADTVIEECKNLKDE